MPLSMRTPLDDLQSVRRFRAPSAAPRCRHRRASRTIRKRRLRAAPAVAHKLPASPPNPGSTRTSNTQSRHTHLQALPPGGVRIHPTLISVRRGRAKIRFALAENRTGVAASVAAGGVSPCVSSPMREHRASPAPDRSQELAGSNPTPNPACAGSSTRPCHNTRLVDAVSRILHATPQRGFAR